VDQRGQAADADPLALALVAAREEHRRTLVGAAAEALLIDDLLATSCVCWWAASGSKGLRLALLDLQGPGRTDAQAEAGAIAQLLLHDFRLASTNSMAPSAHGATHTPQPLHLSSSIFTSLRVSIAILGSSSLLSEKDALNGPADLSFDLFGGEFDEAALDEEDGAQQQPNHHPGSQLRVHRAEGAAGDAPR